MTHTATPNPRRFLLATEPAPVSSRLAHAQANGNELATLALIDRPADLAAVDAAWQAGARWTANGDGSYSMSLPGALETLVIVFPDFTADLGSNLDAFRDTPALAAPLTAGDVAALELVTFQALADAGVPIDVVPGVPRDPAYVSSVRASSSTAGLAALRDRVVR